MDSLPPSNPPGFSEPPTFPRAPRPPAAPPSEPRALADIARSFANPLRAVDVVLGTPERSRANVETGVAILPLALFFVFTAALYAIPFGLVLGLDAWWKIGVLMLGSMAICVPSLHVFAAFLGLRMTPTRIAAVASVLPAAAALFTASFAPILAFLRATFDPGSQDVTWIGLAKCLLAGALAAGAIQLARTLPRPRDAGEQGILALLIPGWLVVFGYVLVRMVRVLHLFG